MDYPHQSGLEHAHDRASARPNTKVIIYREGQQFYAQAAELNEQQSLADRRFEQIGGMSAKNGDRIAGCEIVVDRDAGTVQMGAGIVYVGGHHLPIQAATLATVSMSGEVIVGCRLKKTVVTELEDPTLLGLEPGTAGEGEPGAAREEWEIYWGHQDDGVADDHLTRVYTLLDGSPTENQVSPALSGVARQIANYDRVNNGNFIAQGFLVRALGKSGTDQEFVIGAGLAHIDGFQRQRNVDLRFKVLEEWDTETIVNETHQFTDTGGGQCVIKVGRAPIDNIDQVVVIKERTETITRGSVSNSEDPLSENSVQSIQSVVSGGTTYTQGTDFKLTSNKVDWSLGGAEPSGGSTYDVAYRYAVVVVPVATGMDTVTVSGGVIGTNVTLDYTAKLPRFDILGIDASGEPVYLKGVSSRLAPKAPFPPANILVLAEVQNYFDGAPHIVLDEFHRVAPHEFFWRLNKEVKMLSELMGLNRLHSDIHARDPVAKKGQFVDPFTSDRWRDQGEAQSLAIGDGVLQLAIDQTLHDISLDDVVMLDFTEKVHAVQDFKTGCMKINPYQNFDPLPASMSIEPSVDFWTEEQTQWTSPVTNIFNLPVRQITERQRALELGFDGRTAASRTVSNSDVTTELFAEREERIQNLRSIDIAFAIEGFGNGEILQALSFDGIDVTPAGPLTADATGKVSGTFTIPADVPSGRKAVIATGGSGAEAEAMFVGEGTLDIGVMRRVTAIEQQVLEFRPPPGETTLQRRRRRDRERRREERRRRRDPLAQIFFMNTDKHLVGVDVEFCAIGDPSKDVTVELVRAENGLPTEQLVDQAIIKMADVVVDQWTPVRFRLPPFIAMSDQYALVFKTNDANHALAVAAVGKFDQAKQQYVTAQPYTRGSLLSSSDAMSWLVHPEIDLKMRLIEAEFDPVEKSVELGQFTLTAATDIALRAAVDVPSEEASFRFELERADGKRIPIDLQQPHKFPEYVSEQVKLFCILRGNDRVSPTLFNQALLIAGKIRETGEYVSRAFDMGDAVRVVGLLKTFLPNGAGVTMSIDKSDDNWIVMTEQAAQQYGDNWSDRRWEADGFTTDKGRVKIELSGGPSARPLLQELRASTFLV